MEYRALCLWGGGAVSLSRPRPGEKLYRGAAADEPGDALHPHLPRVQVAYLVSCPIFATIVHVYLPP